MSTAHGGSKHSSITIVHGQPRLTVTRNEAEKIAKDTAGTTLSLFTKLLCRKIIQAENPLFIPIQLTSLLVILIVLYNRETSETAQAFVGFGS